MATCEAQLIESAAQGDQEAFRHLWEIHHAAAMAAALRLCHQHALDVMEKQRSYLHPISLDDVFELGVPLSSDNHNVFVLFVYTVNMDNLHEQQTAHLIVYHIIWCLKRRRRIVRGEIAQRLEQLVNQAAVEHNWHVLNLSIQPDHVHLFIRSNPYTEPSDIARFIKGRSSHVLREAFPSLGRMPSL